MQFANPIWLWALGGLLVPIGIHLFSRKEGIVIPMGSLRYLRETSTARYRNLRLNEIFLLLIRCLLVTLLVFLLADIDIPWSPQQEQKWLLIEPGIEQRDDIKQMISKLEGQGFQVRSLATGFPSLSANANKPVDNYWNAARQLASRSLDSIVVISHNYLRNFRGERIAAPPHMKWLAYPAKAEEFIAYAYALGQDSVWIRKGHTSAFTTRLETMKVPLSPPADSVSISQPEELDITIFADEDFRHDEQILLASLRAIQTITPHNLKITSKKIEEANDSTRGIVFWLAPQPPSASLGNLTIAFAPCNGEDIPLIAPANTFPDCPVTKDLSWVFTKRLNQETALSQHLTLALARLILPSSIGDNSDQRVLPESMMWSSTENKVEQDIVKQKADNTDVVIITLFILLLITERAVAFKRSQ